MRMTTPRDTDPRDTRVAQPRSFLPAPSPGAAVTQVRRETAEHQRLSELLQRSDETAATGVVGGGGRLREHCEFGCAAASDIASVIARVGEHFGLPRVVRYATQAASWSRTARSAIPFVVSMVKR